MITLHLLHQRKFSFICGPYWKRKRDGRTDFGRCWLPAVIDCDIMPRSEVFSRWYTKDSDKTTQVNQHFEI
ncbi:hypothetical protein RRG08_064077 [Elysia crispata]|uniref:Uncharacterized protein n=1 Tax=Elysia crispata TaxID=231223 RepID=A0AAE0YER2_9GAST|nr:hypothetical protein RRG08_064077 [Elysia crispata]